MGATVEEFDPARATEAELRAFHDVMTARYADDRPRWVVPTYEELLFRLRTPFQGLGPPQRWVARLDDEIVGFAELVCPDHTALAEIVVHPRARRRGVGAELLRTLLPEAGARGRTRIEAMQVTKDGDGARWASGRGFRTVNSMIVQQLELAGDDALWHVPVPPGYRLTRWTGSAPDDLLESYSHARNAIHDASFGEQAWTSPRWTPERTREAEQDYLDRGAEQRVVVAVHEATDEVVGMTELELHPGRPRRAMQHETSVTQSHRGHGLGRCMKAHMVRWVRSDRPAVREIYTGTSAGNVHMARVNHSIGFETIGEMVTVNALVAEVRV